MTSWALTLLLGSAGERGNPNIVDPTPAQTAASLAQRFVHSIQQC